MICHQTTIGRGARSRRCAGPLAWLQVHSHLNRELPEPGVWNLVACPYGVLNYPLSRLARCARLALLSLLEQGDGLVDPAPAGFGSLGAVDVSTW
jgi:hypothetical protein